MKQLGDTQVYMDRADERNDHQMRELHERDDEIQAERDTRNAEVEELNRQLSELKRTCGDGLTLQLSELQQTDDRRKRCKRLRDEIAKLLCLLKIDGEFCYTDPHNQRTTSLNRAVDHLGRDDLETVNLVPFWDFKAYFDKEPAD